MILNLYKKNRKYNLILFLCNKIYIFRWPGYFFFEYELYFIIYILTYLNFYKIVLNGKIFKINIRLVTCK